MATSGYFVIAVCMYLMALNLAGHMKVPVIFARQEKEVAGHEVKSTAVVKYSRADHPVNYQRLKQNFDLNLPPSNWLYAGSKWENYIQNASLSKQQGQFASFNMAHCFPDMTGDIDVVTDAENIKKLLKMPFGSKGHVSMMVHRVGNSLLLDEFDIHKHLLRQQQNDWKWLRRFYYETVAHEMQHKDKYIVRKNKSRDFLQNRNMFSKFLYYSSCQGELQDPSSPHSSTAECSRHPTTGSVLPDNAAQGEKPEFQRTVSWTFEDIRMLIGTDLPIFGGGTHPCVSLRLRDMEKPINVLTGLDYWLDNLMCNVPELAMCYHVDGIVQKYELLKTEDIPNMSGSKFSPQVVKDIAQNILSFLKSNATKEGHTYWLFKGSDDEVVKLYDLSTLCADHLDGDSINPFAVPVGILLYRVARNMCQAGGKKKTGTIRTLLENCVLLLDKELHSQVITSAHYLLSDLYITDDILNISTLPANKSDKSKAKKTNEQSEDTEDNIEQEQSSDLESTDLEHDSATTTVDVKTLCVPESMKMPQINQLVRYPPISGNSAERCKEAIKHIAEGLRCLDTSAVHVQTNDKHQVDEQARCNPSLAIPLRYKPLISDPSLPSYESVVQCHQGRESQSPEVESCDMPESTAKQVSLWSGTMPPDSWHASSKVLLLLKVTKAYFGLAETRVAEQSYGEALRYLKLAMLCFSAMKCLNPTKAAETSHVLSTVSGLCGDVLLMLSHSADSIQSHSKDFDVLSDQDTFVHESAMKECKQLEYPWLSEFNESSYKNLSNSIKCYRIALDTFSKSKNKKLDLNNTKKRLANALNELGVCLMNKGTEESAGNERSPSSQEQYWIESMECFEEGIKMFESIGDEINMSLLYANRGRLMRLWANASVKLLDTGQREFSAKERHFYLKAAENYQKGRELLEKRETHPGIWDSITWELSTVYFTMATLLQDYAPLSRLAQEQVEREVTDLMTKTLKFCDTETESPRLPTCQYRAATVHYRLASLYHNAYRNQLSDQKKRHLRQLAELHYGKACTYFTLVESSCELLRVQLEQVAMCEYQLHGLTNNTARSRTLQTGLSHLLDCGPCLKGICTQLTEEFNTEPGEFQEESEKLLTIFQSRLNFFLMNLVKNLNQAKKGKAADETQNHLQTFKTMYGLVLKHSQNTDSKCDLLIKYQNVTDLVKKLNLESNCLQLSSNSCSKLSS